ncbi:MAG TPA: hypothetical protein VN612_15955 [Acidobacteriaceae bacterium]|nr:hypothetical protein [Acidobacteriaceae bacterium]
MGRIAKAIAVGVMSAVVCAGLSGCLVVSYSSESGWWVWPGSAIVTLAIVMLWWLTRRR